MARKQVLRNIGMLALAAALCIGLLALPTRDAQAAAAAIGVPSDTPMYDKTFSLTATPDDTKVGPSYNWDVTGGDLTIVSGKNTDTCTFRCTGVTTASVACNITYTTGDADNLPKDNISIAQATRTLTISEANQAIFVDQTSVAPATPTFTGDGTLSWAVSPNTPEAGFDSTTGKFTPTATAAAAGTYTVHASVTGGTNYADVDSNSFTVTISQRDPNLTLDYSNLVMKNGESETVGAAWAGGGALTYTFTSAPAGYIDCTQGTASTSESSFTIDADGNLTQDTGTATLTVSIGDTGIYKADSATCNVSTSKWDTTLSGVPASVDLTMNGSYTYSARSSNTDAGAPAIEYEVSTGLDVISMDGTHKITPAKIGSATVTVWQDTTKTHKAASVTSAVRVGASASAISSSTAALTSVGGKGTTTISVDFPTEEYTFAVASNLNPLVASVRNTAVTGTSATYEVTAHKAGTTQVVLTAKGKTSGTSLTSQTYYVTVTLPASSLSLDSWYDNLYKNRRYSEVTAYVRNPGSTLDEGSAVEWWVDDPRILDVLWYHDKVQRDGNTYFSRVRVKALRSGTTHVHVRMADGSVGTYKIVTHMGSYIPQTGQDSTAIYVVGALLLLSATATAFVYGKRRRNRS